MKKSRVISFLLAVLALLSLCGCGGKADTVVVPVETVQPESVTQDDGVNIIVTTPSPIPTLAPTPTPSTAPSSEPTVAPSTQPTAVPSQAPAPTQTPAPTAAPGSQGTSTAPKVTKDPTDETVEPGGSCWFVAKYENAIWAEWHFVSPDGKTDLTYDKIGDQFKKLEVVKGFASTMQLKNIPAEMDGWKVYCRFSNNAGQVKTAMAKITVTASGTAVSPAPTAAPSTGAPKVTKNPTDETVQPGGSCWFVAKYENAIWAEWHFVSPDGKTDLTYDKIGDQFKKLEVVKGFASTMQLKNIPAEMDGWKVYCRFSNKSGQVKTTMAKISVSASGTPASPVPTVEPVAGAPKVTKNPTDETVKPGGSCWFEAKYENAIWAEWHFVSPDGKTDLTYDKIGDQFKKLEVVKGYASSMQLKNIPEEMNGWKVYCRFRNNSGETKTQMATLNVLVSGTPESPVPTVEPVEGKPKVTKNPSDETVQPGGSCWFEAKYENAIWAEWHFVSPDGKTDLSYDKIGTQFAKLEVEKGYSSSMQLKNIPAEMDGWMVYCRFRNNAGEARTETAKLSVQTTAVVVN